MDKKKMFAIREVLGVNNYSLTDLAAYVKRTAPEIGAMSADRAYNTNMNNFLMGLTGAKRQEVPRMKIPYADNREDQIGHDLWMYLSFQDVSVEDLHEYVNETLAERKRSAEQDMRMSQMLREMDGEVYPATEIFARHQQIEEEGARFNMSKFLQNLETEIK